MHAIAVANTGDRSQAPSGLDRPSPDLPFAQSDARDMLSLMPYRRDDCLFCKIVAGETPADVVHRDDHVVAVRDIDPQAPTHILLVPTTHYGNAAEMATDDPQGLAALVVTAGALAESEGVADAYRLVFNTGLRGGQVIFHTHLHLLGGRRFGWPPG